MRGFLLLITTFGLIYIAYYLDHYTALFHARPQSTPVSTPTPNGNANAIAKNEIDPLALRARALTAEAENEEQSPSTAEPLPTANRLQNMISRLQASDPAILDGALNVILEVETPQPPLAEAQSEKLSSLVLANYSEDLSTALLPYFNERNYSANTVDKAIKFALRASNRDSLRLIDDRLRSNETLVRESVVKALASVEPVWLNSTIAEVLWPTLTEQLGQLDSGQASYVSAMQKLLEHLNDADQESGQQLLRRYQPSPTATASPTPTSNEELAE